MKTEEILKKWEKHFNEGNLLSILNLYEKECILLPTFSNEILSDTKKIKEYFFKCLIEKKVSVEILFDSINEKKILQNIFLLTGIYTFKLNRNKKINARFTFIISPKREKPIIHHHSSQIPF